MHGNRKKGFYNLNLFDGISDEIITDRMIRIIGDRIAGMEDLSQKTNFPDYEWTDLKGYTLMPGLIDAHIHITVPFIFKVTLNALRQMNAQLTKNFYNCIKYGVTTVRDMGAFPKKINQWRKKIDSGKVIGPRIVPSHSFITSKNGVPEMAPALNFVEAMITGGQFVERLETPDQVDRVANRLVNQGARWLKTQYSEESFLFHGRLINLSDQCFQKLRSVANLRKVGMAMHHTEIAGFKKGVQIGVDTLEHCATGDLDGADIDSFVDKRMAIVPTLKVLGDSFDIEMLRDWLNVVGDQDFMPEPLRQSKGEIDRLFRKPYPPADFKEKFYPDIEFFKRGYPVAMRNVEKMKKAGARIGVGTDTCGTGLSFFGFYFRELEHLTQAGYTNAEALKAATSINACIIGMSDDVGSVEPKKFADFIVVEGDPLKDIRALQNIRYVVKGGDILIDLSRKKYST
jgi:imidazolonepropionase-like amidohydrolase